MSDKPLLDWNNQPIQPKPETPSSQDNPMLILYGGYSDSRVMCKHCTHLVQLYASRTVYKCLLRGVVGSVTDHRSRYRACAKFEERTGPIEFLRK
jgi:hypothetical protein